MILRGDRAERLPPKRVDYLLRYTDGFPIAVVEAKEKAKPAVSGLDQAKGYARDLGLAFAYACNGCEILELGCVHEFVAIAGPFPYPGRTLASLGTEHRT